VNPRDRLYTALSGGVPDRVPVAPKIWVDLAGALTGTALEDIVRDPSTALEVVVRAGLQCGADAVRQFQFPPRRVRREGDGLVEIDRRGRALGAIDLQGGLATRLEDPRHFVLEDPGFTAFSQFWSARDPFVNSLSEARRIAVPTQGFLAEIGCGERQRRVLREHGDQVALIGDCGPATLAFLVYLRGMSRALIDLIDEPRLAHTILEKGAAIAVEKGKFNLELGLKALRVNDSVGNMSVVSPGHWREFDFPHLKDLCTELHAYDPEARVYCHICGDVMPVAEDLVAAGLDCIGPLDPLGGFTAAEMRLRVGDRAALLGGVNTLSFVDGTPEGIEEEARRCMAGAGESGGYVLSSGCVIPRSAPLENLQALRRAAERWGVYRQGRLARGTGSGEPQ
jgi:hypothetical protein